MSNVKQELEALLSYLVGHNDDHAEEIVELAEKSLAMGLEYAYNEMMAGAEQMKESNKHLKAALQALRAE